MVFKLSLIMFDKCSHCQGIIKDIKNSRNYNVKLCEICRPIISISIFVEDYLFFNDNLLPESFESMINKIKEHKIIGITRLKRDII